MCTLIILRRPDHPWPLLLAGNRDEMRERPWLPPARHWDDRPEVVAGLDQLADGSWMGINDHGVAAVVMNRSGTLGPDPHRRSRGELVLEALDHAEAHEAARALADLAPESYRGFNLFIGDPRQAFLLSNDGSRIRKQEIGPGLHMLTALELNDAQDPRIAHYLPRFSTAPVPNPETGDWSAWSALLAATEAAPGEERNSAMCFDLETGFGTRSSSLIALPAHPGFDARPLWLFAADAPNRVDFENIDY